LESANKATGTVATAGMPSCLAIIVGQLAVSWSSDRRNERWHHTYVPMFTGAALLVVTLLFQHSYWLTITVVALAIGDVRSYVAPFYALPKLFLGGRAAAGAIGFINAVTNLGGFVGPPGVGKIAKATGSFNGALAYLAATTALPGVCILALRVYETRRGGPRGKTR
jgi:ACS family tartrate transporter-like MFS transporter